MTKQQEQTLRSPRVRYLIAFSVLIMLTFGSVVIYQGKSAYNQALRDGEQNSTRLANILGEHVELSFLGVDLYLRRAIERQSTTQAIEQDFDLWLNSTQQIAGIALIDDKGIVKVSANKSDYKNWLDYNKKQVGKDFFKYMSVTNSDEVFIGKSYIEGQKPIIIMNRRFNKPNGEFGGVVVAAIDPQYFVSFYDSIASGNNKFMSIMLYDTAANKTTILASSPYKNTLNEFLGREFLTSQKKIPNAIYYQNVSSTDSNKIIAIKFLQNIHIAVQITIDEDDYLANWQQSRLRDVGFLVLFTIFGSILSFFAVIMARQIMRVQESESSAILASQAKSEFLANMSHELRTPLNAIIGFSEMINSGYFGPLNAKQKERIYDINLCGSHLLQLISDILEFSKGDAGKLELIEEKVNLGDLVTESVRIMRGKIKTKEIELVTRIEPSLPLLWGDARKIRQVLINLLSNAFKFTPERGLISVTACLDSHQNLMLIVSDSGIGIAEADIPKALSVFGQVHRSQNHEGTGLGLPLCKMYAELHDGKLVLTSKQNEGTTVKIIFPHQRSLPNKPAIS